MAAGCTQKIYMRRRIGCSFRCFVCVCASPGWSLFKGTLLRHKHRMGESFLCCFDAQSRDGSSESKAWKWFCIKFAALLQTGWNDCATWTEIEREKALGKLHRLGRMLRLLIFDRVMYGHDAIEWIWLSKYGFYWRCRIREIIRVSRTKSEELLCHIIGQSWPKKLWYVVLFYTVFGHSHHMPKPLTRPYTHTIIIIGSKDRKIEETIFHWDIFCGLLAAVQSQVCSRTSQSWKCQR